MCLFGSVTTQSITDAQSEKTTVAVGKSTRKLTSFCKAERNRHEHRTQVTTKVRMISVYWFYDLSDITYLYILKILFQNPCSFVWLTTLEARCAHKGKQNTKAMIAAMCVI